MLVVVLLLVVLAAGVLVGAVGAGEPEWGWISVVLSVLGAALLLAERRRRRGARAAAAPDAEMTAGASTSGVSTTGASTAGTARQPVVGPEPAESGPTSGILGSRAAESARSGGTAVLGSPQDGDATQDTAQNRDTGRVDGLPPSAATKRWERPPAPDPDAQVLVVDEYPRYHLAECPWLRNRETIRLVFREAQELGFTPCARCAPYATLAGRAGSS